MPIDAIESLLTSAQPGGVFWLKRHAPVARLSKLAMAHGFAFFHLEGKQLEKKEQFLNHAASVMHFPDYFGHNWDAFEECLTDFEWIESKGFLLYFDHTDAFAQHHESQLETVLEIFTDAASYWRKEKRPMVVLLSGTTPIKGIKSL